jgi:spore coat protein U-like protein
MLIARAILLFNGGKAMKKNRLVLAAVTAGALAMATSPLIAALVPLPFNVNLPVTANIAARCDVSTTGIAFGTYDPTANTDQTGTITIQCTKGTSVNISLNEGNLPAGRQMTGSGTGDLLTYELYSDAARTSVWGSGNGGSTVNYIATDSSPQNLSVYGRIPLGQINASVDAYSDVVVINVAL